MKSNRHDFPFGILDVAELLHLKTRSSSGNSIYVDCPFCNDRRGKLNLNFEKDVWRCNYCGAYGGMLALYAKACGVNQSEALQAIYRGLGIDAYQSSGAVREHRQLNKKPPEIPQSTLASIQDIHRTFSTLLSMLSLSDKHREHLRKQRGLTDEQIEQFGYKSTPTTGQCLPYTEQLIRQGCRVEGVPGFYKNDAGKWTVKFHTRTSGILIPIRGIDGLIRGLQTRLDSPIRQENDPPDKQGIKYLTLSSSNKARGVTSGSPIHFVGDPHAKTVYVTEGALKADVAHSIMDRTFAAMIGANNTSQLEPLFSLLANNGTELIVEAQDMDKYRNEHVAGGASKIYLMARKYGMKCRRLTWNPNYKGIDDWQLAVRRKELRRKEERVMNFKQRYLYGQCDIGEIDEHIAKWIAEEGDERFLGEYLGLTASEFCVYTNDGQTTFEKLLQAQRRQQQYRIYQLIFDDSECTKAYAFSDIDAVYKAGFKQPPASDYRLICEGSLFCPADTAADEMLQRIFDRYNDELPDEYAGRSLAPSDIVELYDEEQRRYYYRNHDAFVQTPFSPILAKPMIKSSESSF